MPNTFLQQIGQQIGKLARGIFGGGRVPDGTRTNVWGVGSQEVYAPVEQEQAISKGFNANTAVYSIVKKYAKKSASIPIYLEDVQAGAPMDGHPLQTLLNRPNKRQAQSVFFKLVFGSYKLFGEAFIWFNRGDAIMQVDSNGDLVERDSASYSKMPILEMFCIPANHIVIIPDPEDPFNIIGYQLHNRPNIKFRPEDMMQWMDINLDWDEFSRPQLRGMSPLKPGYKTLTADNSAVDSMVRMFQNDGAKGAIYNKTLGAKMGPVQQAQLQTVIDNKVNNKDIKNAIAALEGDWGWLDFGLTAVDMETIKGREFIYKEFCFLFGVPYALFDTEITYANQTEAKKGWISDEIRPDCNELNGELQRGLFAAFGLIDQTSAIKSNFDVLPELQEDKAKLIEWMNKAPLTGNQRLEALDYETSTDPAMDEITTDTPMTPIAEDPALTQALTDVATMDKTNKDAAANG